MSAAAPRGTLALVVLAAGASERLGEPKALARLRAGGRGTALALLLEAGASLGDPRPLVVTGRDHARVIAHAERAGLVLEACANEAWREGRTGSVRLAAAHRPGLDLCLAPVDVPLVPAPVFAALAAEWQARGRPALGWLGPYVEHAGARRFGHPVVVGRELARALQAFPAGAPLSALRARADPQLALSVPHPEILDDLDSPADLARLRARDSGE